MTGADVTESVLEAADASGVPFSGLTRMLVHHEVSLDVTAPHWAVDSALYAERRRDVTVAVAVVWESSVRSYLNLNSGPDDQFERVRRGVYKLS